MGAVKGNETTATDATLKKRVEIFRKHKGNVSATARELGISRSSVQHALKAAESRGIVEWGSVTNAPNLRVAGRDFSEIIARRKEEFKKVARGGTFRTPHKVNLPDDLPFMLVLLGDPHLDNPGTDLRLWEKWIAPLDRDNGIMGICLGDWLDNWLRFLGHIYGGAETTVDDAWTLLNGYIEQMGDNLLASVSGNHDDWGNDQALRIMLERQGVIARKRGLRLDLRTPEGHSFTIGLRHRFAGHSMWNPAHAITKAAQLGWRDDLLVGGDKHVSGKGYQKDPETGMITHCYQVAAFKMFDDYAEEKGFIDKHISPAIAFVVDPTRPNTDPGRVVEFMDPDQAVAYLKTVRKQAKTKARAKTA